MWIFEVEDEQAEIEHKMLHEEKKLVFVGSLGGLFERLVHFFFVVEEDVGSSDDLVGVRDLFDHQKTNQHPRPENEVEEELVVVETHARVDPVAVVIHLQHAPSALSTMMSALGLHNQTLGAESEVRLGRTGCLCA